MKWGRWAIRIAVLLFLTGIAILFEERTITGAVIGTSTPSSFLVGLSSMMIAAASALMLLGLANLDERIRISTNLNPGLERLAKKSMRAESAARDIRHLEHELNRGHFDPGMPVKHLSGTDLSYLRGHNGGRVFYRQTGPHDLEIVAVADKHHEQKVIDHLRKAYKK